MLERLLSIVVLASVASCAGGNLATSSAPTTRVGAETDDEAAVLARLEQTIRADALASYGAECGTVEVPDDAFIPVEITGGGIPELALPLGRIRCGIGANRFSGTGGVVVQFWIGSGGPPRLLLEQQMHGFTPASDRLVTVQHGSFCDGGAGPDLCRVVYRWSDRDRRLGVVERRRLSDLGQIEEMRYGHESLYRFER
jgi:hypothetical protein